ncbi:unnamed protein product [Euphydryas editha]|uniref:Uncharacterized protein n=1 Tax=Euphydryas editha TaxID=104508 RepID=A0AAU9TBH3_EUPED|nr:unnamed protein product [Euphydryas editha]
MFRLVNFCLLVIVQVVNSDPIPAHCWKLPPGVISPEKCCKLPEIFTNDDFEACGLGTAVDNMFRSRDCSQNICLLKRYNAMKNDNEIDKNTIIQLMDTLAENNNDYKDGIEEAKKLCVENDLPESLNLGQICKPTQVISCITGILIKNCPKWEESENCNIMKTHVKECSALMQQIGRFEIYTLLILLNILSKANGQFQFKKKPEKCYGTDELMERKCCIFPPFFKRDLARACGAIFALVFIDKEYNVTGMRRETVNTCDHWRCILNKYGILDADDVVNNEKYYTHLDKWTNLNLDFSNIMTKAKVYCKEQYRFQMPLNVCEFFDFQSCIRNYVLLDCPKIRDTQKCHEWKEFYDECREFFI